MLALADPISYSKIALYTVGFITGFLTSIAGASIALRLAGHWLGFPEIEYSRAFKSLLIAGLIILAMNFSIGFNHGLATRLLQPASARQQSPESYFGLTPQSVVLLWSPLYFLWATVFSQLLTAAIFRRLLWDDHEYRISLSDSVVLATFQSTLTITLLALIGGTIVLLLNLVV